MAATRFDAISPERYAAWFKEHHRLLQQRSPFHHPAWLEAVGRGVGFELRYIGIYEGPELVGAVPGFLTRRGPFRLFGSPLRGLMTSYLGPVSLRPSASPEESLALIGACGQFARRAWGAAYVRFNLRDAPAAVPPRLGANWELKRSRSYRLELAKGEEALWAGLKSSCRGNIRKARRQGVEIVPFDDPRLFYQMLDETFRRHGTTSWHPRRFFELIFAAAAEHDILWPWGARYEGQIIAAGLFLRDDREVHFVSGASLAQHSGVPTSYLLHWEVIRRAAREGLRIYNSDASRIPSIDQFKESFGPELERRGALIWAPGLVRYAQDLFLRVHPHVRRLRGYLSPGR